MENTRMQVCKKHGETMFSRHNNGNGTSNFKCKKCNVEKVNESRKRLKTKAIQYKGGSCGKCGYNKCEHALQFHHLDPEKKDFIVNVACSYSWERVKVELDKCIMLCANCHAEEHYCNGR